MGVAPRWFVTTGLRLAVKQPDSRGIPGFFVVIVSVVTWIYACPVGWYNRRMEFLGRTGLPDAEGGRAAALQKANVGYFATSWERVEKGRFPYTGCQQRVMPA